MEKNYNKIGNISAVIVVILAIFMLVGFVMGISALFWVLAIFNIVCGPVCFILYLIEVKRGVFATEIEGETN